MSLHKEYQNKVLSLKNCIFGTKNRVSRHTRMKPKYMIHVVKVTKLSSVPDRGHAIQLKIKLIDTYYSFINTSQYGLKYNL
jgi:hypothetical protein